MTVGRAKESFGMTWPSIGRKAFGSGLFLPCINSGDDQRGSGASDGNVKKDSWTRGSAHTPSNEQSSCLLSQCESQAGRTRTKPAGCRNAEEEVMIGIESTMLIRPGNHPPDHGLKKHLKQRDALEGLSRRRYDGKEKRSGVRELISDQRTVPHCP